MSHQEQKNLAASDPEGSTGLPATVPPEALRQLVEIRGTIDNIDAALVHLLAERFRATQRVGYLKANYQLPAADPSRESAQIDRLRALAEEAHLDPEFAEKFLNFIISEVIRHHERIAEHHGCAPQGREPQGHLTTFSATQADVEGEGHEHTR